jgi:hypothetical protein
MSKIKYILVLALLTTGCQDMKMDRKVQKSVTISQSDAVQLKPSNA